MTKSAVNTTPFSSNRETDLIKHKRTMTVAKLKDLPSFHLVEKLWDRIRDVLRRLTGLLESACSAVGAVRVACVQGGQSNAKELTPFSVFCLTFQNITSF